MSVSVDRNDQPGCWAFGISRERGLGILCLHFAVWHLTFYKTN